MSFPRPFTLVVDMDAGTALVHVCRSSIQFAKELDVTVKFDFNGVTCYAYPHGDAAVFEANINEARNKIVKVAQS